MSIGKRLITLFSDSLIYEKNICYNTAIFFPYLRECIIAAGFAIFTDIFSNHILIYYGCLA
jgi:hypothetical protein